MAALNALDQGGALVVHKVGMLGQDFADGLVVLARLHEQGVSVKIVAGAAADDAVIREHVLDLGRDIDRIRRSTLASRIKDGQNEARERGARIGRPRVVDYTQGESHRVVAFPPGTSPPKM